MDPTRFDTLARLLAVPGSRRRFLGGLLAGAFGIGAAGDAAATPICRPAGSICREDVNCCVGHCVRDARRRRRCGCPPGTKVCRGACIPTGDCCTTTDCPPTGNECITPTCTGGFCGTTNLDQTHVLSTGQTAGDCQQVVCNGAGGTTSVDDPTDLPTSSTVCKINPACTGNPLSPSFTTALLGTDCTADNQLPKHVCDGAGSCVQCNTNGDCSVGHCSNHVCVSSCFVAGTRVAMADGTTRPIETIEVGDMVLGRHGGANRVSAVERPLLGGRMLYALNGDRFFVTAEHPFLTEAGWKAVDPAATAAENPALSVGRLTAGDRLLTLAAVATPVAVGGAGQVDAVPVHLAAVPLRGLMGRTADPATPLYNLLLDGDHAYFADDWLVHNKD